MTREVTTDLEVLRGLVVLAGRDILDVGCGPGTLVRELVGLGARAVGLETTEEQLGDARSHGIGRFVVGRAEALPLPDGAFDAVLFMRSLHHVPEAQMLAALADARRVLRGGGSVYVAEPLAEGDHFELVSIVDDETEVRAAAQRAIESAESAGLRRVATHEYGVQGISSGMAALRRTIVGADPTRAATFDAREAELAEAFARLGTPVEGGRLFTAPMRADLLGPALPS